jgi:hypothetical protein
MSQLVDTPDGTVEFPDHMSAEQIQTALLNHYQGGHIASAPDTRPIYTVPGRHLTLDPGGTDKPVAIADLGGSPQPVAPEAAPTPPAAPGVDRGGFINGVDAAVRGVTKGALGNWDDEITSGINAVLPLDRLLGRDVHSVYDKDSKGFWDAFKRNQDQEHAVDAADANQNPMLRGVGTVAGTVAGTVLGGRAVTAAAPGAAGMLERMATLAPVKTAIVTGGAGGAAYGGISGAGEADPGERVQGFKTGAGVGGLIGATLAPAIATIAPAIARYGKVLFNKGVTPEALAQLTHKLQQDGYDITSPSGTLALQNELSRFSGKPVSLADIGTAIRARTGVGLRAPSEAQQPSIDMLMARSQGQGQRLAGDIRANVAPRTDVHALDEALVEGRKAEALPLRDAALFEPPTESRAVQFNAPSLATAPADAGVARTLGADVPDVYHANDRGIVQSTVRKSRVITDPVLNQLARLPLAQKALSAALENSANEVQRLSALGESVDHLPDLRRGSDLDMRTLDTLKRFLDDQVSALYRKADTSTFKAHEAANVKALRDALRDRMKVVVPQYGEYLDSYKGSSDLIDALGEGRTYDELDPEVIAAGQADRTKGEQELYKVGVARNLLDIIKSTKDGRNPASRILNSDEAREQLAATGVGPDNMTRLNESVNQERQLNLLPAELSGAQTAQRLAAAQDADSGVGAFHVFNPSNPSNWLFGALRAAGRHVNIARNAKVNEALLPRALATDKQGIQNTIRELQAAGQFAKAAKLRKQTLGRRSARVVGSLIGGPLVPHNQGDK